MLENSNPRSNIEKRIEKSTMNVVRLVIEWREMKVLWSWGDLKTELQSLEMYDGEREGEETDNNKSEVSGINE